MSQIFQIKIGEASLEQLRDQTKAELFGRFLPNMEKFVIDNEYGGFMCDIEIDTCKLVSADKSAWYEGRGIWVYSFLYNHFGQDPRHLEIARKSKDFILRHQPQGIDFWPASYTREGTPKSGPGDIYGNLFIAEGLIEFSKASGERRYLALAKKIILSARLRYDQPDYRHTIRFGLVNVPEIPAPRVLGHWMIFLHLATQFLEHETDPDIEELAASSVKAIIQSHLNPEYHLLNECLHHDFRIPDNEWGQFVCLGHACESLWMVMAEAVRRRDAALFHTAAALFRRHVTVAADPVEGGYLTTLEHVSDYIFQTSKVLWFQEEILNGMLLLIEHFNDEWAHTCFAQTYAYIQEKFVHPEYAFVVENGDRKMVNYLRTRAEHYHHPRRLMFNLLTFERILGKKGNTSGIFG